MRIIIPLDSIGYSFNPLIDANNLIGSIVANIDLTSIDIEIVINNRRLVLYFIVTNSNTTQLFLFLLVTFTLVNGSGDC
jgi:hypothetical protein